MSTQAFATVLRADAAALEQAGCQQEITRRTWFLKLI
jgi:hypothetical protein